MSGTDGDTRERRATLLIEALELGIEARRLNELLDEPEMVFILDDGTLIEAWSDEWCD
jgi:hypothetical protein